MPDPLTVAVWAILVIGVTMAITIHHLWKDHREPLDEARPLERELEPTPDIPPWF